MKRFIVKKFKPVKGTVQVRWNMSRPKDWVKICTHTKAKKTLPMS